MKKICESLRGKVECSALRNQLVSFAYSFESLAKTLPEEYDRKIINEGSFADELNEKEEQLEDAMVINHGPCRQRGITCRQCIPCAFQVLYKYSLNSTSYNDLYVAYQYLLTLAVTQVECERVFSKLKLIKTRLRARMTQENLESSMLMSVQHEYMNLITSDEIIDKLAATSKLMKTVAARVLGQVGLSPTNNLLYMFPRQHVFFP